jgi:GAF domain-containing protein
MLEATQTEQTIVDGGPAVAIPIKVRGHVEGVVRLRKADDTEWSADELALMETLTEQLSVALDTARLYQDTQRRAIREQLTGAITARIRETLDVETVLKTAASQVREVLGLPEVVVRLVPGPGIQPNDGDQQE